MHGCHSSLDKRSSEEGYHQDRSSKWEGSCCSSSKKGKKAGSSCLPIWYAIPQNPPNIYLADHCPVGENAELKAHVVGSRNGRVGANSVLGSVLPLPERSTCIWFLYLNELIFFPVPFVSCLSKFAAWCYCFINLLDCFGKGEIKTNTVNK